MGLLSLLRRVVDPGGPADSQGTNDVRADNQRADGNDAQGVAGPDSVPPDPVPQAWRLLPAMSPLSQRVIARTFDADVGKSLRAQRRPDQLLVTAPLGHTVDPASVGTVTGIARVSEASGIPAVRAGADGVLRRRVLRATELAAVDRAHPRWSVIARLAQAPSSTSAPGTRPEATSNDEPEPIEDPLAVAALPGAQSDIANAVVSDAHAEPEPAPPVRSIDSIAAPLPRQALITRLAQVEPIASHRLATLADPPRDGDVVRRLPLLRAHDVGSTPAYGAAEHDVSITRPAATATPVGMSIARAISVPGALPASVPAADAAPGVVTPRVVRRRSIEELASPSSIASQAGTVALPSAAADLAAEPSGYERPADASTSPPEQAQPSEVLPLLGRRPGLGAPLGSLPLTAQRSTDADEDDPFAGWDQAALPLPLATDSVSGVSAAAQRETQGVSTAAGSPASPAPGPLAPLTAPLTVVRRVAAATTEPLSGAVSDAASGEQEQPSVQGAPQRLLVGARALHTSVGAQAPGASVGTAASAVAAPVVPVVHRLPAAATGGLVSRSPGMVGGALRSGVADAQPGDRGASGQVPSTGQVPSAGAAHREGGPGGPHEQRGAAVAADIVTDPAAVRRSDSRVWRATDVSTPANSNAVPVHALPSSLPSTGRSGAPGSDRPPASATVAGTAPTWSGPPVALRRLDLSAPTPSAPGLAPGLTARTPLAFDVSRSQAVARSTTALLERLPDGAGVEQSAEPTMNTVEQSGAPSQAPAQTSAPGAEESPQGGAPADGAASQGEGGGAGPAAPSATSSTGQADTDLDLLAGKLYDRIRFRLRRELLDDRERAGLVLDRVR